MILQLNDAVLTSSRVTDSTEKDQLKLVGRTLKFSLTQKCPKTDEALYRFGFYQEAAPSQETVAVTIPADAVAYHANYVQYLAKAWGQHHSIVVSPKYLWYTVLMEIATAVKADPETYRSLFSTEAGKQEIVIMGAPPLIDIAELVRMLRGLVPTDVDLFLPALSDAEPAYNLAAASAFCDMASPYYNYSMYCCAFPRIRVDGRAEDYTLMAQCCAQLHERFATLKAGTMLTAMLQRAGVLFNTIAEHVSQSTAFISAGMLAGRKAFWESMFKIESCGSGSDVVVDGWIDQLFCEKSSLPKPENFPPHIARVDYRDLNSDQTFSLCNGLFSSQLDADGFLVPSFSYVVHRDLSEVPNGK